MRCGGVSQQATVEDPYIVHGHAPTSQATLTPEGNLWEMHRLLQLELHLLQHDWLGSYVPCNRDVTYGGLATVTTLGFLVSGNTGGLDWLKPNECCYAR